MNKRQSSFLASVKNVLGVLAEHAAKLAGISVLADLRKQIQTKVDLLDTITEEQERSRTGITADKNRIRDLLTGTLIGICGPMQAWARQNNQPDVAQRTPATKSSWIRLPQGKVAERATDVLELARKYEGELKEYGLTSEQFDELEREIAAYDAIVIAPRSAVTRRKTLTGVLDQEIGSLTDLLGNVLDPLMQQFETSEPALFADYENARVRVRPATTPVEVVRERAAAKASSLAARKEAKAARIAVKATAKAEAKAQRDRRLAAIANGKVTAGTNGRATVAQLRETTATGVETAASALPN